MVFLLLRLLCVLILIVAVLAPLPAIQLDSVAAGKMISGLFQSLYSFTMASAGLTISQAPVGNQILRFRVVLLETRTVPQPEQLTSIVVVSPEIAAAVLSSQGLTLTGLRVGETMLIGFAGTRRFTFIVQVVGRTYAASNHKVAPSQDREAGSAFSGSYSLSFSAPLGGAPTLLHQSFDFHKKLTQGRTLRFSSDIFKFMGQGDRYRSGAAVLGLGLNRMSLGIDGPEGSIDILDSNLNISPLSFNGSTMRGFHMVSTAASPLQGIEIFAGQARPSLSLFDMNQGRVLGIVAPVVQGNSWRVRAGMFVASPGAKNKLGKGGTVWHLDGRYAPTKDIALEGEAAYANGGLSWRARVDFKRGPLTGSGEIVRFDRGSPLISIGAQAGGRETEAFALHWRAGSRFSASFSYNHTAIAPPANAGRAHLNRSSLTANASFKIDEKSQLNFRFAQQKVEVGPPGGSSRFQLQTQTATIGHNIRFNKNWSNNFQAQISSSRELRAGAATDDGFILNDQLRYAFKRGSATAFVRYARQNSTIVGLLVRNPTLLPSVLQSAFAADPVGFLQTNHDSLGLLLPGIELPQTRGLDLGVRLQAAFSKINVSGEVRYSANEILARQHRRLVASVSMNLRLDTANSLQVRASRSFGSHGTGGQSALTVSYVHRFGAGSGGGLQFSRLLGLERGKIQGRVFFDQNGNGHDDINEPGVAGMKVQLGGDRIAMTDAGGRFHFDVNSGGYQIRLISKELGERWRASTMTEQNVFLAPRQTVNISFGITDYGLVAGRVFNDVSLKGNQGAGSSPGVPGVRLTLRPVNGKGLAVSVNADGAGAYQFRSVSPGRYTLELDPASLPPDFRMLGQTSWPVIVQPLINLYLDIPISAQRAISGVVFIDQDGDGKFTPEKDRAVEGARVVTGKTDVTTGKSGAYILRNLPSGSIEIHARTQSGGKSAVLCIALDAEPTRRSGVNFAVPN
jgi:hypothetical protein